MPKSDMSALDSTCNFFIEVPERRLFAFRAGQERAKQALAGFSEDCEVFGFTKGQFSFVELIDCLLDFTGPADLTVSTWTAAAGDASFLGVWAQQSRIRRSRWILDYSFQLRRGGAEAISAILDRFGPDSVRITKTHAKFALIQGDARSVICFTSMNLNQNPRFEFFHASTDTRLINGIGDLVRELWQTPSAGEQASWRPQDHKDSFEDFRATDSGWPGLKPLAVVV